MNSETPRTWSIGIEITEAEIMQDVEVIIGRELMPAEWATVSIILVAAIELTQAKFVDQRKPMVYHFATILAKTVK